MMVAPARFIGLKISDLELIAKSADQDKAVIMRIYDELAIRSAVRSAGAL